MSIYLGNHKVGITRRDGNAIDGETLTELQDAVGYRVGDYSNRTVAQMITDAKKPYFITHNTKITNSTQSAWTRPVEWPDLDSLNLTMSGNDYIYMTYDNTGGRAAVALHIEKVSNGTNITVSVGHISNGTYVVDSTIIGSSNNYVKWLTASDGDYPVVRITGDIKFCYCYSVTNNGITQSYDREPFVERIAYIPHLTHITGDNSSYTSRRWGSRFLQREKIGNGTGSALVSLYYAYAYCQNLQSLDLSNLYTPNVTNCANTFFQCAQLRNLDLSHWNVSKLQSLSSCFYNCYNLQTINLSGWQTNALTNLNYCFSGCISLQTITGLEDLNVTKVTGMGSTFYNLRSISSLDLSNWTTGNITSLASTFSTCVNITELDLSGFHMSTVTNMASAFQSCASLKRIKITSTTGTVTNFSNAFYDCRSLQEIDMSKFPVTSSCTNVYQAFCNCHSVKELDLTNWDVSGVTGNTGNVSSALFSNCYSLEKIIGVSNWTWNVANSLANCFNNCYSLKDLDISGWSVNNITSFTSCFNNCRSLKSLNLGSWAPSNCTDFSSMFNGCHSLETVGNISNWNTNKVTTMASMFRSCYSLRNFPSIQNWNYSKVKSMDSMFEGCWNLQSVTWKNISLPVCTTIAQLLRNCYNLKYADLSGWTVSAVTNTTSYYHTLGSCWRLETVVGFPIPSTYTNIGFQDCSCLSYTSLMTIVNALPTVTGTHTLRIPAVSLNLLNSTEKAIATGKGWTLANS